MEFGKNLPGNYKSNKRISNFDSSTEDYFPEVKNAFDIIKSFANIINNQEEIDNQKENDLINALSEINKYLIYIKKSKPDELEYLTIIAPLIQIFISYNNQGILNNYFLELFHRITSMLPDSKILEYFSNQELFNKLMSLISDQSSFSNISSRVVSHLIISRTITNFYSFQDFLNKLPFISEFPDKAYYLFTLAEASVPSEFLYVFLDYALKAFNIDNIECVIYCCEAISDCINDNLTNENDKIIYQLNCLFNPFLAEIESKYMQLLINKETVEPIIEMFECLFDNCICIQFFANPKFVDSLFHASIDHLSTTEELFCAIFPFFSDIFHKCRLPISQELFNIVISSAAQGSFKTRKYAFLFISNEIDQIIEKSPQFFEDCSFYKILIEITLTNANDIMHQLLECISKLLSASQCQFIRFLTNEAELYEDFMDQLDNIEDEMEDSDIDRLIHEIKKIIQESQPRSYENKIV